MKKYLTNVLLLLCLLTACSKSDGGNDEGSEDWMKDFAPTSIRNKGLCLSMGETMNNWYIKIPQKSQNEVLMVAMMLLGNFQIFIVNTVKQEPTRVF